MSFQSAIIHISDTEFGPKNRAEQKIIEDQYQDPYKAIMDNLISDVNQEIITKYNINPEKIGFVFSGDISNSGSDEDFKKAEKWIKYIIEELKIPATQVAIVPGNHDVNWDDCGKVYEEIKRQEQVPSEEEIKKELRCSPVKLNRFGGFFSIMCGKIFEVQSPIVFEGFKQLGVALIGLDTTYPCLWSDEDNFGAVQVEQVEKAQMCLRECLNQDNNFVSIAVMHHSLMPRLEDGNTSSLRYAREIKRWLELGCGFEIVLCGHEHTSERSRSIGKDFNILVTGSFGLSLEELMKKYKEGRRPITNKYQVALLAPDRWIRFLYRKLNREDAAYPMGKWIEDESEGTSFDDIVLRDRKTTVIGEQPKLQIDILNISNPVPSSQGKRNKNWAIGVKVNEAVLFPKKVKSATYKVEPGGDWIEGDTQCNFLASLPVEELEGRSINARIELEDGGNIPLDNLFIPPPYNPSEYVLSDGFPD